MPMATTVLCTLISMRSCMRLHCSPIVTLIAELIACRTTPTLRASSCSISTSPRTFPIPTIRVRSHSSTRPQCSMRAPLTVWTWVTALAMARAWWFKCAIRARADSSGSYQTAPSSLKAAVSLAQRKTVAEISALPRCDKRFGQSAGSRGLSARICPSGVYLHGERLATGESKLLQDAVTMLMSSSSPFIQVTTSRCPARAPAFRQASPRAPAVESPALITRALAPVPTYPAPVLRCRAPVVVHRPLPVAPPSARFLRIILYCMHLCTISSGWRHIATLSPDCLHITSTPVFSLSYSYQLLSL